MDEPPEVTGLPSVNYAENGAADVATYTADDPEGDPTVGWTLGGADYDDFSISNEGVLTFKTSPNYEAPADADGNNVYQVTIKASDGAKTGNLEVTVTVTDENEPPAFASGTDARTIAENTAAGPEHRNPGVGHRPGRRRNADLHAGRDRCHVLQHNRIDRAVADQSRLGL